MILTMTFEVKWRHRSRDHWTHLCSTYTEHPEH